MSPALALLLGTAATVGLIHTILGPDHYIPFVALAKVRGWSRLKTLTITTLCGIGHVAGSIILGFLGLALGWALGSMESFEAARGEWAAWGLIGFGLAYGAWGVRRAVRNRPHSHAHVHVDGTIHTHGHGHSADHAHVHQDPLRSSVTPWTLFIIFVLGPCEPLIPMLMVPGAQHDWMGVAAVAAVFGLATIATMCVMVLGLSYGLGFLSLGRLDRWSHALAGFSLVACGGAIKWLGL